MAFSDWSTTASSNTSVGGVSIAEGMTPGNVNNAMRAIMADAAAALGTTGNPQFTTIELGHASDTTLARTGAGIVTIEGNVIYRAGGTDVPVADGGTGASTVAAAKVNLGLEGLSSRNAVINGAFNVAQRGTSFTDSGSANNDDTYNLDRWYLLSDGNDVVDVSQDTADVPTNGLYAAKMLVVTVDTKFGLAQIIEQKNCIGLIGETVTLSFKAKVNNATRLDKIKAGIIAWSGTADTVTSDIISAWGTDGTTPTLIANATFENTPADLGVTTSWASYSVSALIDTASAANIIVFIWSDNVTDTDAADTLAIADVQLEYGATATNFERRPYGMELDLCRRYYKRQTLASTNTLGIAQCYDTNDGVVDIVHCPPMRTAPTGAISDVGDFAAWTALGVDNVLTAFSQTTGGTEHSRWDWDATDTNLTAGHATNIHSIDNAAWISHDAEL